MAKTRKKTILKHCSVWTIWYLINILQLAGSFTTVKLIVWLEVAYNYTSLVLIFYTIAWLMTGFYRIFSFQIYKSLKGAEKVRYLFNNRLLLAMSVIAVYVCLSVTLDNIFFGYEYPTVVSHIIQRLTRVLMYAVIADRFAYFANYKRRVSDYVKKNERRFFMLNSDNNKIKERFKVLDEEKLFN
jgi:hypothetical protein